MRASSAVEALKREKSGGEGSRFEQQSVQKPLRGGKPPVSVSQVQNVTFFIKRTCYVDVQTCQTA